MPRATTKNKEPPPPTAYEAVPVEIWLISPVQPRLSGFYKKLPEETKPKQQKGFPVLAALWKQEGKSEDENGHFDGGFVYAILQETIKPGQYKYLWMATSDEDDIAPGRGTVIGSTNPHNPQGVPKNKQLSCCHKKKCKLDPCREEDVMNKWSCGNPKCQLPLCRDIITKEKPKLIEPMIWITQNRFEWEKWLQEWAAAMPEKMYVIAPPTPGVTGEYIKTPGRLENGCVIWQLDGGNRGYLYSARGGVWVVASNERHMEKGVGCLMSDGPHLGKEPQDCAGWKFNAGLDQGWFVHPQIRVTTSGAEYTHWRETKGKRFGL
eukprot:gnl/MRDRNA2_/MRDRNA2_94372_c0_seq1.p1 gnl/MRDRNA2_/MRDRNA2_94372_c0~~gnl/MRDRNA2_/MRDRNA2_94372_c0_seq1.p1  ORF type:complete len:321 (-),score=60.24 gnl/MRDRNA2_/MRDRNA2_94372_c0_seq1:136-1098(-)